MTYLRLDIARRNWRFTRDNRAFKVVFAFWIAVPALLDAVLGSCRRS